MASTTTWTRTSFVDRESLPVPVDPEFRKRQIYGLLVVAVILLLAGLIGMGISLVVVGEAFHFIDSESEGAVSAGPTTAGIVTVGALVVFITSFAFSLGPVVWTVINEVFPARVRGRGVALATAANWGSAYLVSQFFLSLVDAIGSSMTFWLFAFFCGVGFVWVYRVVPETKRQSLEQIQQMWARKP